MENFNKLYLIQILHWAVPILIRSTALNFFERGSVVALGGEPAALCYLGDGKFRIQKQIHTLLDAVLTDELKK